MSNAQSNWHLRYSGNGIFGQTGYWRACLVLDHRLPDEDFPQLSFKNPQSAGSAELISTARGRGGGARLPRQGSVIFLREVVDQIL